MNQVQTIEGAQVDKILAAVKMGTVVNVSLAGVDDDLQAKLVGLEESAFILLRFVRRGSISENLYENNRIKARFIVTGKVLGFETIIKAHLLKGALSIALLEYPNRLETYDARQSKRVSVFVPAEVELNGQIHQGIILDMSAGGVLFSFAQNPENTPSIDERTELSCEFLGVQGIQRFGCLIKSIRNEQGRLCIGLCYHNLDPTLEATFNSYLEKVNDYLDFPDP
jgi:hypothetical protein